MGSSFENKLKREVAKGRLRRKDLERIWKVLRKESGVTRLS